MSAARQTTAITGVNPVGGDGGGGGSANGGYDPRSNPLRGVAINDRATVSLLMYDANLNFTSVNTGGESLVPRNTGPVDGGANRNGTGRVRFFWDEVVVNNRTVIRCTMSTSNGEAFVPENSQVPTPGGGSAPAVYWSWHFGSVDPVNFQSFITNVTLSRATISFSNDGGQSYFSTVTHTNTIPSRANWNPGVDNGQLLNTVGDGTNSVLLQYEVTYVPSAGSIALLSGGLLAIFGRRRRSS